MAKQPTALAKVIVLIEDMKRANKDDNSEYYTGKWAGLDEAIMIIRNELPYERNTMESCLNIDLNHYPPHTASDYFTQNYTQDGK